MPLQEGCCDINLGNEVRQLVVTEIYYCSINFRIKLTSRIK